MKASRNGKHRGTPSPRRALSPRATPGLPRSSSHGVGASKLRRSSRPTTPVKRQQQSRLREQTEGHARPRDSVTVAKGHARLREDVGGSVGPSLLRDRIRNAMKDLQNIKSTRANTPSAKKGARTSLGIDGWVGVNLESVKGDGKSDSSRGSGSRPANGKPPTLHTAGRLVSFSPLQDFFSFLYF
jgi:hypothetical protein